MLLNIKKSFSKYRMKVRGVVEVGAHWGQEYEAYYRRGVKHFIFIEPCRPAWQKLLGRLDGKDGVDGIINCACGDFTGEADMFTGPTNEGMSNSLLKPKVHLTQHPDVLFNSTEKVKMEMLDNIPFDRNNYNLLSMDCQGFEDRVLRGAVETLKTIDYIYTEVNREFMYEDCALVEVLDKLVPDFTRVETRWASERHGWGDSLYIRKSLLR